MREDRLGLGRRIKVERIDVILGSALLVLVASYALGYRLDWSRSSRAPTAAARHAVGPEALAEAWRAAVPPALRTAKPAVVSAGGGAGPAWARDPRQESWERMTRELERTAKSHRGRVAIYLKDLRTGRTWSHHPDELFPAASLVKVPILASAFYRIREGRMSLSQKVTLRRRHRVGGSGTLKWRRDGTRLAVRDVLQRMISDSDNTATKLLLETMGMGYVQRQLPRMGLLYTGIYREGMSIRGGRVKHENYTTAREMSMLLEKIYRGELVDKPSSQLMLRILKRRRPVRSRIAKSLPVGWEIAHKTGLLRRACHDSAIVFSPDGDYVLTVLTGRNASYRSAKRLISRLGRATFRHYKWEGQYLARAPRRRDGAVLR